MDNMSVDITSEEDDALQHALAIVWEAKPYRMATHYRIAKLRLAKSHRVVADATVICNSEWVVDEKNGTPTLILYWTDGVAEARELPYPLSIERVHPFAVGWLEQVDYGPEPDHDGDNGRGWRVFTGLAGYQTIVAIQPVWALYGK